MSYQILSLKWRPASFDQIVGQDHITQTLKNAISMNRLAQAFLFSGPRGVGKTTTARVLASTINEIQDYENFQILYGGSVKSTNSKEILNIDSVDGVLVGGASLDIKEFNKILSS